MAKSKSKKIEIISITYKSNGEIFTAKPVAKKVSRSVAKNTLLENRICAPGDTKCENGELWRCFDIGGGQSDWLTAGEPC